MIRAQGLRWSPVEGAGLGPLDLVVGPGERVLVASRSGGGKSTLLRALAGLLARHRRGELGGRLVVGGEDPAASTGRPWGLVVQEAPRCFLCDDVDAELRFACEAARVPGELRAERVARALAATDLDLLPRHRAPAALSGGEAMRLAVALALVVDPPVLLLDEPLASLDSDVCRDLLAALSRIASAGKPVVMAEHRIEEAGGWAQRLVLLRDGAITHDGAVDAGRLAAEGLCGVALPSPPERARGAVLARHRGTLPRGRWQAPVDVDVAEGQRLFVRGPNGSGKSTLLAGLAVEGRRVDVPQDADLALAGDRVDEEVPDPEIRRRLGLDALAPRGTLTLSRGERVRVALGSALCARPDVLLLDEPTAGQDRAHVATLFAAIAAFPPRALVVATHDEALLAAWASDVVDLGQA